MKCVGYGEGFQRELASRLAAEPVPADKGQAGRSGPAQSKSRNSHSRGSGIGTPLALVHQAIRRTRVKESMDFVKPVGMMRPVARRVMMDMPLAMSDGVQGTKSTSPQVQRVALGRQYRYYIGQS